MVQHTGLPPPVAFVALPDSKLKHEVLIPVGVLTAFAMFFCALRWYSRLRLTRKVGAEDYILTVSLVTSMAITAILKIQVDPKYVLAIISGDPQATELLLILVYTNNALYQVTTGLVRTSIFVQFLHIFKTRTAIRTCWAGLILQLAVACYGFFGEIFLCMPIEKNWRPTIPGRCNEAIRYWYSAAALNITMDFLTWLLPMPFIKGLRLPLLQKMWLLGVFAIGGFVCTISLARLFLVRSADLEGNWPKAGARAILWSAVEVNVAIICGCLMVLKPLLTRYFPRLVDPKKPAADNMRLPLTRDISFGGITKTTSASRSSKYYSPPASPGIKVQSELTLTIESRDDSIAYPLGVYGTGEGCTRIMSASNGLSHGSVVKMEPWREGWN